VVPDGAGKVDERVAGQQSLQSWSLEPAEKRGISDFLPTTPLAVPGEVLQMFRLGMHDVEVGGPGGENGLLRVGRQSSAELVFGLRSSPLVAHRAGRSPRRRGCVSYLAADRSRETIRESRRQSPSALLSRMSCYRGDDKVRFATT